MQLSNNFQNSEVQPVQLNFALLTSDPRSTAFQKIFRKKPEICVSLQLFIVYMYICVMSIIPEGRSLVHCIVYLEYCMQSVALADAVAPDGLTSMEGLLLTELLRQLSGLDISLPLLEQQRKGELTYMKSTKVQNSRCILHIYANARASCVRGVRSETIRMHTICN